MRVFTEAKNPQNSNKISIIIKISTADSSYYQDFSYNMNNSNTGYANEFKTLLIGMGILRSVKEDLEQGFLERIQDLVVAEVFTDFLDQASYLLGKRYKDPAAVLAGAVLEDGLKKRLFTGICG